MDMRVQGKYYIKVEKVTCDKCTMGKVNSDFIRQVQVGKPDLKSVGKRKHKCKECDGTGKVLAIPVEDLEEVVRGVLGSEGLSRVGRG